jgi:beta-catenin-like protein 1
MYASEILSVLLQSSVPVQIKLGEDNGIEMLLKAVAQYKRRDPQNAEETEMMENLFDCLCLALMSGEQNQSLFLQSEGLELMILMIREKKLSRKNAVKVLDYALMKSAPNCQHFVEVYGLKTLFSVFMRRGNMKKYMKLSSESESDENVLSCLVSLFQNTTGDARNRLLYKFVENVPWLGGNQSAVTPVLCCRALGGCHPCDMCRCRAHLSTHAHS